MTPNYNQKPKPTIVDDIMILDKMVKTSASGTTYCMFESSVGTLVCFAPAASGKLEPSDTTAYSLGLLDAKPGFKHKSIALYNGSKSVPKPVPPPPAEKPNVLPGPAEYAAQSKQRVYSPTGKEAVWEEKDCRISKLSIFSSLINLTAAKVRADAEFAKKDLNSLVADATAMAYIVTQEFIYGAAKSVAYAGEPAPAHEPVAAPIPAPAPAPSYVPVPVSDEPPFMEKQTVTAVPYTATVLPMQYSQPPVFQQAAAPAPARAPGYIPPPQAQKAAPTAAAPVMAAGASAQTGGVVGATPPPTAAPAGANGPAAPSMKAADANKLFGAGSEGLEARMAERLRALTNSAKRG